MSIKIDGQDWRVKTTTEPIGGEGGERFFIGEGDEAENAIFIDGTLPKTRQQEVFLHEMIHQADTGAPEFLVSNISKGLYGMLKDNGLITGNFLTKVVDGEATRAEMDRINERSNKMAEEVMSFPFLLDENIPHLQVSEKPWYDEPIDATGQLQVLDKNGALNRTAAHRAVLAVTNPGGMNKLEDRPKIRSMARQLLRIYEGPLMEIPPASLRSLAR